MEVLTRREFFFSKLVLYLFYKFFLENEKIILEAELFSLDGSERFYEKKIAKVSEFRKLGKEIGQILK